MYKKSQFLTYLQTAYQMYLLCWQAILHFYTVRVFHSICTFLHSLRAGLCITVLYIKRNFYIFGVLLFTHSIDIKLFTSLAESQWADCCPFCLSKVDKQFDVNALCKRHPFL